MHRYIFVLLFLPAIVSAETKPTILGGWSSYKVVGKICAANIHRLGYYFGTDGKYEVTAELNRFGQVYKESAQGTYEVNGDIVTAQVGKAKIGPYRYRFEGSSLVITQTNPNCEIFLTQSDAEEW